MVRYHDVHSWRKARWIKMYHIDKCTVCGLYSTRELIDESRPSEYSVVPERENEYVTHVLGPKRRSWDVHWPALELFRRSSRLLEVGSGYGFFLDEARRHKWKATGVEPGTYPGRSPEREAATLKARVSELGPEYVDFDIVALWDVIEHVADGVTLIKESGARLRPGGALVIRTPNGHALDKCYGLPPKMLLHSAYLQLVYPANPAEHVFHYTPETLESILNRAGFTTTWIDTRYYPGEAITHGRNALIGAAKRYVARASERYGFPYEFTVCAIRTPRS
jgi:2-polyprenyl-3-methyl-5-hydroxy-6-metoxy-1,4-benzoquinol methylase